MPGIDGFEVARQIAARGTLPNVSVMMLSSSGEYALANRSRELFGAYLSKPVKARDLFAVLCDALQRVPQPAAVTHTGGQPAAAVTRLKVLVVEDNLVNQRVAVGILTRRGHAVSVAHNGVEAVDAVRETAFDVILMDIQMPQMGGLEATQAIRAFEAGAGRRARIIAVTAHAMKGDRENCLAAGMDDYLPKPIDRQELLEAVELAANDGSEAPAASAATVFDVTDFRRRLDDDEMLMREIVHLFLSTQGERLGQLETAVGSRDAAGIRAAAHALKGAAASLSAGPLAESAAALEVAADGGRLDDRRVERAWNRVAAEAARLTTALETFHARPA